MPFWEIQKMTVTVADPPQPAPDHVVIAPAAGWEEPRSFQSLGLVAAGRSRVSQAASTFRMSATGRTALTDDPAFEYKEFVQIYRDGQLFFQGSVTMTPREAGPASETIGYTVSDLWWWMERIMVSMSAQSGESDTEKVMRFLGEHTDGSGDPLTTSDHFDSVIAQAQLAGVPIAKGSILAGHRVIKYDFSGALAEAFKTVLQGHPDAVVWIDHTAAPLPTVNIGKRADLPSASVSIQGKPLSSINIKARPDLRPDCIRIIYAKTTSGLREYEVDEETIGSPLPPLSCMTIDLNTPQVEDTGGVQREYLVQRLKTRNVPADGAVDDAAKNWWIQKIPGLKQFEGDLDLSKLKISAANAVIDDKQAPPLTIEAHKVEFADDGEPDPDPVNPAANPAPGADPADYPQELVNGQIEGWMNVRQRTLVARVTLGYERDTIEAIADQNKKAAFQKLFPTLVVIGGKNYLTNTFSAMFEGTNGTTKVYRALKSITVTEPTVPADGFASLGLAQKFRDAMAELHYDGSFTLTEAEAGGTDFMGRVVNIPDGRSEWQTMNALVQQVDEDLQTGETTVTIGPPEQVDFQGLQDKAAAVPKTTTYTFDYGDSSSGNSDGPIGGYATPVSNTSPDTPGGQPNKDPFYPARMRKQGGQWQAIFNQAWINERDTMTNHQVKLGG